MYLYTYTVSSKRAKEAKMADQHELIRVSETSAGDFFPSREEEKVLAEGGGEACPWIVRERLLMASISTVIDSTNG